MAKIVLEASNVDTILQTALEELGRSLHASDGLIQLEIHRQGKEDGKGFKPDSRNSSIKGVIS